MFAVSALPLVLSLLPGPPPELSAGRVAAVAGPYLAGRPFAAVTVGVSTPAGRAVYGFGTVDPAGAESGGPPVAPDGRTVYEIGSITKAFVGLTLARMVADGTVNENDPAAAHLPADLAPPAWAGPDGAARPVTLRALATHTSGLPVQPPTIGLFALFTGEPADPYAAFTRKYLAQTVGNLAPAEPGRFAYSNLGVGLLGHALANAETGDPLAVGAVSRLTDPLGLADTAFTLTDGQRRRFPRPHEGDGTPTPPWTFATLGACGGLRSTADDLLTLADACLGRGPVDLSPAFASATSPRESARRGRVGLCWFTDDLPTGRMVWHNGGTGGSRSFLGVLPDRGAAVVVLANCGAPVDRLAVDLLSGAGPKSGAEPKRGAEQKGAGDDD